MLWAIWTQGCFLSVDVFDRAKSQGPFDMDQIDNELMDIFGRDKLQGPVSVDHMSPWTFWRGPNIKDLLVWTKCLSDILDRTKCLLISSKEPTNWGSYLVCLAQSQHYFISSNSPNQKNTSELREFTAFIHLSSEINSTISLVILYIIL